MTALPGNSIGSCPKEAADRLEGPLAHYRALLDQYQQAVLQALDEMLDARAVRASASLPHTNPVEEFDGAGI